MIKNTIITNEDKELQEILTLSLELTKRVKQLYLKRIVTESEGNFNASQRVNKLCLANQCAEELNEELREAVRATTTQESYWATEV